ncbi:MAG: Pr6Pr family membrane protein [Ignavibacteria bacterium]|nr:Pr6Pr family membrane protein [Ignavibacteria bacterium]
MKKLFAVAGALAAWFALILQLYISLSQADSRLYELIKYLSFMTIWTNFIVAVSFTFQVISTESRIGKILNAPSVQGGILLYIIVVALVYHLVLANIWDPKGPEKVADEFLHTVVPVLYLLYWIFFVRKGDLRFSNSIKWLIYPLIYLIYSLIRGALTGLYPYYFMNVAKLGYAVTFRNIGFIMAGYILLGIIIILIDKILARKKV